ncbi:hypothetical protein AAMO2058_001633600 [Amorphochlora amoebiformis]
MPTVLFGTLSAVVMYSCTGPQLPDLGGVDTPEGFEKLASVFVNTSLDLGIASFSSPGFDDDRDILRYFDVIDKETKTSSQVSEQESKNTPQPTTTSCSTVETAKKNLSVNLPPVGVANRTSQDYDLSTPKFKPETIASSIALSESPTLLTPKGPKNSHGGGFFSFGTVSDGERIFRRAPSDPAMELEDTKNYSTKSPELSLLELNLPPSLPQIFSTSLERKKLSRSLPASRSRYPACNHCHTKKSRCPPGPRPCHPCKVRGNLFASTCKDYVNPRRSICKKKKKKKLKLRVELRKRLADKLNVHWGQPCLRNPQCSRPMKHPGHCKTGYRKNLKVLWKSNCRNLI